MNVYKNKRERIMTIGQMVAGTVVSLAFVAPLLWMLSTALKQGNQAFSEIPTVFFYPTLENLRHVFVESKFGSALATSLFTAISSTILALILGSGIAYPLARRRVPGQKHISSWILSLRIIPPIVVIIPLFLSASNPRTDRKYLVAGDCLHLHESAADSLADAKFFRRYAD